MTKVIVTRNGAQEQYSADIVVVSCGAVNSAALLLRSANDKHPGGLANSSDVVGRHYMRHNCSAFMAISKDPNPTVFQKTLALNDFYFRSDDWEYPLGEIQMLGKSDGEMLKGEAPGWAVWKPEFAPRLFGGALHRFLAAVGRPAPSRQPRDHQPDGQTGAENPGDEPGRTPAPDRKAREPCLVTSASRSLLHRSLYLGKDIPIGGTAHQAGTVRFGRDPENLGAGRELQSARSGQPLRGRCQLLCIDCGREPQPDHHGQRAAGRRPFARKAGSMKAIAIVAGNSRLAPGGTA